MTIDLEKEDLSRHPKRSSPRALRIALVTMEPENYSCRRLIEEAQASGHMIDPINTLSCYMDIHPSGSSVHYDGKALMPYDAVIPRIGTAVTAYGTSLIRQFEMTGALCLNRGDAVAASRDKLFASQTLAHHQIPMPATAFANSTLETEDLIDLVGGPPLLAKLVRSTWGHGIALAQSRDTARALIDAFRGLDANFLVQKFIEEARGHDVRYLVLGREVIAAMERQSGSDEFRSNLHLGGTAHPAKMSKQESLLAIKATDLFGLTFAGVDILRSNAGPLVLEVNSSPGLQGIETVSKVNVAGKIIAHLEHVICRKTVKKPQI